MENLKITEYKNIRVLTTQQIAEAYKTDSKVISNNFNRNKERCTEGFVKDLTRIAIKYDCLILLVAHRRKNSFTLDANDEISGSGDITSLAGITLSYDRGNKEELEAGQMTEEQRKLVIAKNRLFGKLNLKGIILSYEERSKRIYGKGDDMNRQFGWDKSDGFVEIIDEMEIPFE